jgi:hypothetical protein
MQFFPGKFFKAEALEKVQVVGEDKNLFQPQNAGLLQAALDQPSTDAPILVDRQNY